LFVNRGKIGPEGLAFFHTQKNALVLTAKSKQQRSTQHSSSLSVPLIKNIYKVYFKNLKIVTPQDDLTIIISNTGVYVEQ